MGDAPLCALAFPQRCPLSSSVAKIVIKPDKPMFDLSGFWVDIPVHVILFVGKNVLFVTNQF